MTFWQTDFCVLIVRRCRCGLRYRASKSRNALTRYWQNPAYPFFTFLPLVSDWCSKCTKYPKISSRIWAWALLSRLTFTQNLYSAAAIPTRRLQGIASYKNIQFCMIIIFYLKLDISARACAHACAQMRAAHKCAQKHPPKNGTLRFDRVEHFCVVQSPRSL